MVRFEEWYNFQNNPRPSVNVLVTVDESTYSGGNMGSDHPIAWHHDVGDGRAWYTAMGHHEATYDDEDFRAHVLGGILWAAGASGCTYAAHAAHTAGIIRLLKAYGFSGAAFIRGRELGRKP